MMPQIERRRDGAVELRFPYRPDVVAGLKARIPASCRTYDPDTKTWTVGAPYATVATGLLRDAFGWVEEAGAAPPPRPLRETDPDYAALHLLPSAPPDLVAAAYRTLARLHHPDTGGDTRSMQTINGAYQQLKDRGAA